jgi:hypothetical protein
LYRTLVDTLASGKTVGEACRAIRSTASPESDARDLETLALAGTALFTHVPWLRPFPR